MRIVPNKILSGFAMLTTSIAFAGPTGPPPPGVPPPPGLPVDGGIVLLLIAALSYGLYKVYQFKKNKKTPA
ncbi:PID-CTERM protein-sorting domain-containing protein [Flavobacterium sp.]|uniref:PID-CTERM protein-sorting domain-containing protein n=1 Tax=Flavobacterium sp. TaxID=239 RepID=UPI0039E51952